MANCMIHSRSLAPQYWAEAINCACYIQNSVPHRALKGVTPFKAWNGRKPIVKHFRVFGSPALACISKKKRKAMEPQSVPCIFVGYPDGVKGYRLLHPTTHELFIERIDKYKARLVAKGFSQVAGIDYSETFAPVAKMTSIRLTLAIAATHGWVMHQMDVKSAFLHGDLEEEIYMEQPSRFVQDSSLVCRLRSIYGLKQTPRAWYAKMDSFLLASGFTRCHSDPNVYFLQQDDSLLILVLYVDDLCITMSSPSIITMVKDALQDRFSMKYLGLLHYFLGIEISQSDSRITLAQPKYALDLLAQFHMTDCKPSLTPFLSRVKLEADCSTPLVDATLYRQLVGSLIYLTHSRPDISFAVGMVSRFMQEPHELH
eukprot:Gb_07919 [translate_table: standard]